MKTLSAPALIATGRTSVRARYLLQLDFAYPSALTLRLSDEHVAAAIGHEWLPLVQSWGNLSATLNTLDVDGRPATATIALLNTKPIAGRARLSDLIRSPLNTGTAYEFAFAQATVYELLDEALATEDAIRRGVFYLEEPTDIGEEILTLRMSDQALVLEHQLPVTRITADVFPQAPESVIGQSFSVPFGALKHVLAQPIVDGRATTLDGAITVSATTLILEDATGIAAGDTVQVEYEHILLGAKDGNTFTACTRARNGTTAVAHADAMRVYQLLSVYRFVVAETVSEHPLVAVSGVRVNGELAQTSPTIRDVESPRAGRRLSVIDFEPSNLRQFHVLPVGDAALVSIATAQTIDSQGSRTVALPTGTAEVIPGRALRTVTVTVSTDGPGGNWVITRRPASQPGGADVIVGQGSNANLPVTITHAHDWGSWEDEVFDFSSTGSVTVTFAFNRYAVTFERGAGGQESTAAAVIGTVTCDVEGVRDDSLGRITGTALARIEIPADVVRFVLTKLFPGVSAADLGASWALTRARGSALRWAFLLGAETFSRLRRKFGEQARSVLYLDAGTWEFSYLQDAPVAAVTLAYAKDVRIAAVKRSARTELVNRLTVYAARDYSARGALEDIYTHVQVHEDLAQGLARRSGATTDDVLAGTLELDLVQDTATAVALGDFWLGRWKRQRLELTVEAWHNVLALAHADHVAVSGHPLLEAHGGVGVIFRVVGVEDQPDEGTTRLTLVEANA